MNERREQDGPREPASETPAMTARQSLKVILATAAAIFLADRLSKWLVVEALDLGNRQRIEVFDPFLNFTMAWNRGINFGLFGAEQADAQRWLLVGLAVVISLALGWWAIRRADWWMALGAGIVAGGALGNAWDRVTYGAVADFLNMSCCGIDNPYAFNIADVAIFAGALLIAMKA